MVIDGAPAGWSGRKTAAWRMFTMIEQRPPWCRHPSENNKKKEKRKNFGGVAERCIFSNALLLTPKTASRQSRRSGKIIETADVRRMLAEMKSVHLCRRASL